MKTAATKTRRSQPKQRSRPAKQSVTKSVGQPIEKDKSYTDGQLQQALDVSRPTLWRYRTRQGLDKFATKVGGSWQITGEQYHAWLNWLRDQAKN